MATTVQVSRMTKIVSSNETVTLLLEIKDGHHFKEASISLSDGGIVNVLPLSKNELLHLKSVVDSLFEKMEELGCCIEGTPTD